MAYLADDGTPYWSIKRNNKCRYDKKYYGENQCDSLVHYFSSLGVISSWVSRCRILNSLMKVRLFRRAFGTIATAATIANKATINMIDVNAIFAIYLFDLFT